LKAISKSYETIFPFPKAMQLSLHFQKLCSYLSISKCYAAIFSSPKATQLSFHFQKLHSYLFIYKSYAAIFSFPKATQLSFHFQKLHSYLSFKQTQLCKFFLFGLNFLTSLNTLIITLNILTFNFHDDVERDQFIQPYKTFPVWTINELNINHIDPLRKDKTKSDTCRKCSFVL